MFWRRNFTLRGGKNGKHMQVIGKIGKGKSEFLRSQFVQHVEQGIGCAVIDPHGDLATGCLWSLMDSGYFDKEDATERLLYIDFSNQQYFVPWNILDQPYSPKSTAQNVVEVCRRVWPYLAQAAPQFENVMLSAVTTLVERNEPITKMNTLLINPAFRQHLLEGVTDKTILEFFEYRYAEWGPAAALMRESTLNKAFLLTFNDQLRYTFGQKENTLNFRRLMDEGISVIFNLSGLDEETQSLIGSMLAIGFEQAAFSRTDLLDSERRLFRLIIDEFPNFNSKSEKGFNRTLFGGRKFKTPITLGHQSMSQVTEELQSALENTMPVCFGVGQTDAEYFAPRFGEYDPLNVKEQVPDPKARERVHPERFRLQETHDQWVGLLKKLPVREAFVRVEHRTQRIKSLRRLPPLTPFAKVKELIDFYARKLMTPLSVVKQEVDGILTDEGQKPLMPPQYLLEDRIKRLRTIDG